MKTINDILYSLTNVSHLPRISRKFMAWINGYDHQKYWKRRSVVVDPSSRAGAMLKMYYLMWIKRVDARHCCSFGTSYNSGSQFVAPPLLPHGPNGIICGHDAKIGKNVTIFHQVTIAHGNVVIGDNTELGAGSKILPNVTIGKYCHVGANAVVVEDMPDYSTCVLTKPRIIIKTPYNASADSEGKD